MIPVKDITAHKAFNDLAAAKEKVDHVDMYYNAGHPAWPSRTITSLCGTSHRNRQRH